EAVVLDLRDRVVGCSSAYRPDQAVEGRSVSSGLAAVDAVRPEGRARELLDQEVLLHRQPRAREHADRLGAMTLADGVEAERGLLERVLPGRLVQLPVLAADERFRQPI